MRMNICLLYNEIFDSIRKFSYFEGLRWKSKLINKYGVLEIFLYSICVTKAREFQLNTKQIHLYIMATFVSVLKNENFHWPIVYVGLVSLYKELLILKIGSCKVVSVKNKDPSSLLIHTIRGLMIDEASTGVAGNLLLTGLR